jgi:nitrogen fixation/metabolism regulation signal transduction histidine kinase
MRNYLLDPHFQLKYASYGAGIALVISVALGALLWRSSAEIIEQSQASVELGAEVLAESRKVSEVVAMNIVKDPIYSENPALKTAFEADAKQQSDKQNRQQAQLQAQAQRLQQQRTRLGLVLVGALALLVAALWFAGIVITHKVAGPLFKMKKQLRALERGSLQVPTPLRKGDELKEFFDAFNDMVRALRVRQQRDIERLDDAIAKLEPTTDADKVRALRELRADLAAPLEL